jgi:VanZ family protein
MERGAHASAYVVVTLSLLFAVSRRGAIGRTAFAGCIVTAIAIGIALEFAQSLVGRDAQLVDVTSDAVGALIAGVAWLAVGRLHARLVRIRPRTGVDDTTPARNPA